jgi:hypothetical protein
VKRNAPLVGLDRPSRFPGFRPIVGSMAKPEFFYRFNERTGRYEVIERQADGSEAVIKSYDLPAEAMAHVERLTGREGPPQ